LIGKWNRQKRKGFYWVSVDQVAAVDVEFGSIVECCDLKG
jgi:hypothetical protein